MKKFLLAAALLVSALPVFAQSPAVPADGFVTLDQILSDFSADADAAQQKYNGLRLLVYGRIGQVTQSNDTEGSPLTVYMQIPQQTTPDVKAVFAASEIPNDSVAISGDDSRAVVYHRDWEGQITKENGFIVEGEDAGIRGTFDSFVAGDVVLKDAQKIAPAVLAKKLKEHGISTE